jgi:fermentation-respiration switch protein FrsA (DUF1100 family)
MTEEPPCTLVSVVNQQRKTSWQRIIGRTVRILRCVVIGYLLVVLAMMLLERWLVYPAPPRSLGNWNPVGLGHEDVWFDSADGTRLHGWFVPHAEPKRAILYCHGNGEHIAFNADLAAQLRDRLQASVFLFDYRGYGRSAGRPSEDGCIADGCAAQLWLAKRMAMKPQDVVLMGRSLGSGVAVALAAENGAGALIIENGFPSMPDIAALHYSFLPVRMVMDNRYDSLARIGRYEGPLFQTHGLADTLIPFDLGRRLFDACPSGVKRWLTFPGLGHNSPWPDSYYDELSGFLDSVAPPGPEL